MTIDYNALAAEYAAHRRVHPGVMQALLDGAGLAPASRVLEVGCGTGNYIIQMAELAGCACYGIDPSDRMLQQARERTSPVAFESGRAETLAVPEERYDFVFSVDVIHHVGDTAAYFHAAAQALRPGGRICTVTDTEDIIRARQPLTVYFPETVEAELRRYPPVARLREEMAGAGFTGLCEQQVELVYPLSDAGPYRAKSYSALHLIPQEAFERGVARLERDLRAGSVICNARYALLWGNLPG